MNPAQAARRRRTTYARGLLVLALVLAGSIPAMALGAADEASGVAAVEAVVRSFNSAVSDRDPDRVAAHFADGAVLLSSKPAHGGLGDGSGLAADAVAQWKAVASLLRNATGSYSRQADDLRVRVDGDLATVWCRVRTKTRPLEAAAPIVLEFSEAVTLLRIDGAWKIAAMSNNRPTR